MKSLLTPIVFCGPGSNLYPLCDASPSSPSSSTKALLPLANRPMLAFTLQNILSAGLSSCIVLAPSIHHSAIVKALSSIQLVPPPSVQSATSERRRAKESKQDDRGAVHIVFDEGSTGGKNDDAHLQDPTHQQRLSMRVDLLPMGPHDGASLLSVTSKASKSGNGVGGSGAAGDKERFRMGPLGTAELLCWLDSLGKLEADPLVLPVDLLAPTLPLRDLIDAYVQAQARHAEPPTACCALYERGAGEGVGREREREGPPRLISAFSLDSSTIDGDSLAVQTHSLLFLRDSDLAEDLNLRRQLLQKFPRMRVSTRLLDAHTYILNKASVLPLLKENPRLTSLRDHVLPLIAKASWQHALREKVSWSTLAKQRSGRSDGAREKDDAENVDGMDEDDVNDILQQSQNVLMDATLLQNEAIMRSSRTDPGKYGSRTTDEIGGLKGLQDDPHEAVRCLAITSRLDSKAQDSGSVNSAFVARANTVATYLECNRWLLKALSSSTENTPTHSWVIPEIEANGKPSAGAAGLNLSQVDAQTSLPPSNVSASAQISTDSLLGQGVTIGERASIKRSVIGNECEIGRGARLAGCVLMDGVKVGENVRLENVICCAHSSIDERSTLKDCDIAAGVKVQAETNAKNEKLVSEHDSEDSDEDDEFDDGEEDAGDGR